MRLTRLTAAMAALVVLLSACSTVKLDEAAPVETRKATSASSDADANQANTAAVPSSSSDTSASKADTDADPNANDPLNDPAGVLAKRSIYFDLDSYVVKEEYKSVIDAHGKYLVSRPDRKIFIQGNTDERGGSEYNLALGQKRADAVRRALALQGVPESQMEAVSFGKEKPKATGSNEEAWKENRRADIVY